MLGATLARLNRSGFAGGAPMLAFGSMGGEGQPQTQAALVTGLIDFGYDVQQAIEAPRWLMGRTWGRAARTRAGTAPL
jgi:oxamate amidohydrolase